MATWEIHIESGRDEGHDLILFAAYVTVDGHAIAEGRGARRDILDIEAFFAAWNAAGLVPLFTCTCGSFGCGGYYVGVSSDARAWVLRDWYGALDKVRHDRFEYRIPWEQVRYTATQIVEAISALREDAPLPIRCGFAGTDLAPRVDAYRQQIAMLDKWTNQR